MRADSGAASDASRATEPPSDASARGDDRVERPVGALEPKPVVCLGASGLCGATNRASVSSSLTRTALQLGSHRRHGRRRRARRWNPACLDAAVQLRLPSHLLCAAAKRVRQSKVLGSGSESCGSETYLQLVVAPSLVRQGR